MTRPLPPLWRANPIAASTRSPLATGGGPAPNRYPMIQRPLLTPPGEPLDTRFPGEYRSPASHRPPDIHALSASHRKRTNLRAMSVPTSSASTLFSRQMAIQRRSDLQTRPARPRKRTTTIATPKFVPSASSPLSDHMASQYVVDTQTRHARQRKRTKMVAISSCGPSASTAQRARRAIWTSAHTTPNWKASTPRRARISASSETTTPAVTTLL